MAAVAFNSEAVRVQVFTAEYKAGSAHCAAPALRITSDRPADPPRDCIERKPSVHRGEPLFCHILFAWRDLMTLVHNPVLASCPVCAEPSLEDLLADPIIRLLTARDGISDATL